MTPTSLLLLGLSALIGIWTLVSGREIAGVMPTRRGTAGRWGWPALAGIVLGVGIWTATTLASFVVGHSLLNFALPIHGGLVAGMVVLGGLTLGLAGPAHRMATAAGIATLAAAAPLAGLVLGTAGWSLARLAIATLIVVAGAALAGWAATRAMATPPGQARLGATLLGGLGLLAAGGAATVPGLATPPQVALGIGAVLGAPALLIVAGGGLAARARRISADSAHRERSALAARDRRYGAILGLLDDRLLLADRGGMITSVLPDRPAANHPTPRDGGHGRGLEIRSGLPVWDLVAEPDREPVRRAFFGAQAHRRPTAIVARAVQSLRAGAEIELEMRSAEADPDVAAMIVRVRDVTAEREALRTTEAAARAAEEADRAKTEFLANTSHELRTPLTGLIGALDVLRGRKPAEIDPAAFEQILSIASESAGRLSDLVENLLELTRPSEPPPIDAAPVPLAELVAEAAAAVRSRAAARAITIETDLAALPAVIGDPDRLRHALVNVLDNAVKFGRDCSVVRVAAERSDDGAGGLWGEIRVTDRGIGIPPDRLEAVRAPFTQGDGSASRAFEGLGLGLAVTDRILRDHGGGVAVSSRQGEGTVVRLLLPPERVAAEEMPARLAESRGA